MICARPKHLLNHLKTFGCETTSFQALEPNYKYWQLGSSIIAFVETPKAWITVGSPIGPIFERQQVTQLFAAAAKHHNRHAIWFGVENISNPDERHHVIGTQPFWEPEAWQDTLKNVSSLREQLRRARSKGVVVRSLASFETNVYSRRQEIMALMTDWNRSHTLAPMKFLVDTDIFSHNDERRYWIATRHGKLVGLLVAVPIYAQQGWFFEHIIRSGDAPNGTIESLFNTGLRCAHQKVVKRVTMGLVPLAETESFWLQQIRSRSQWLYNFDGLKSFKTKLRPDSWERVYLAHGPDVSSARAFAESLRAFAGGSFIDYGLKSLRHMSTKDRKGKRAVVTARTIGPI